jgi:hypothetical protein
MIRKGKKTPDDYDWDFYSGIYKDGLDNMEKEGTLVLNDGDYVFTDQQLLLKKQILPLNPVYHLLYETLLQLNTQSVMEIGSGAGDHLHNIQLLSPAIKLYGIDVSKGQVDLAKRRHPNLRARNQQYDIRTPVDQLSLPKVDVAYTMAVIMHIREGHTNALINLFHIASKYVILVENWKRQAFMDDIQELFKLNKIPWKKIYFYYHKSEIIKKDQNQPSLMLISSEQIPFYPVLTDYQVMTDMVTYL